MEWRCRGQQCSRQRAHSLRERMHPLYVWTVLGTWSLRRQAQKHPQNSKASFQTKGLSGLVSPSEACYSHSREQSQSPMLAQSGYAVNMALLKSSVKVADPMRGARNIGLP
jgi:hypothetical protein